MNFVTNILKKYIQTDSNNIFELEIAEHSNKENILTPIPPESAKKDQVIQKSPKTRRSVLTEFDPLYESPVTCKELVDIPETLSTAEETKIMLGLELQQKEEVLNEDSVKSLEDKLKECKERDEKILAELNRLTRDNLSFESIIQDYEKTIAEKLEEFKKLQDVHEVTKHHFTNLEIAFSDVHTKYEKTKQIVIGMKHNEDALQESLLTAHQDISTQEKRYESLKAYAQGQIEKSNRELILLKQQYDAEISKSRALVKRFEIKCKSLEVALVQKDEECKQLSALCDEVTGKRL